MYTPPNVLIESAETNIAYSVKLYYIILYCIISYYIYLFIYLVIYLFTFLSPFIFVNGYGASVLGLFIHERDVIGFEPFHWL